MAPRQISSRTLATSDKSFRVKVRCCNYTQHTFWDTWSLVQWGQVSMRFTGLCCLSRSRTSSINVATPSVLGHWSLSHWVYGDPFSALRYCQKLWSLQGVALGNSHMRCYSLPTMCELVCILYVCTHVLQISLCVTLYFCCFCTKQACVCAWTTLQQCAYSWALDSYPVSQRIKSCLVYNLLHFISLRSHVICSRQPTYLLITPVFSVLCCLIGLKVQNLGYQDNIRKEAAFFNHWLEGMEWRVTTIYISR